MKKTVWFVLAVLVISAVLLAACGGGGAQTSGIKRQNPPAEYANAKNPFEGQADAVTAGKAIFDANCATCHGQDAKGDGPAGASLSPKPANLQLTVKETNADYIHWVDTVGGAAAGLSAQMPSFQGVLSDNELWQVATYLTVTYGGK